MSHQVIPLKYYVGTFLALVVLTVVTVAVALVDFGAFDIVIAMFVACIKASLVMLYFMGLRWEKGFSVVSFGCSILFLILFIALTFTDIAFRGDRHPLESQRHSIQSPVKAPSSTGSSHY